MKRIIFVMLFLVIIGNSFAEECQACKDACHAIANAGGNSCHLLGPDEDPATYGGICAFQCRVVYSREGRCPSADEAWDPLCFSGGQEGGAPPGDLGNGQPSTPGGKCQAVSCGNRCEGMISYYNGECEPSSGECAYFSEECEFACNPGTGLCERNTEAPDILLETTPSSVVISGNEEVDIMVQLVRSTGEAVEGAEVYIRVSDPENTGLLGDWGFMDVKKYTDGGGIASATLGLPSMKSIDRIHYEEFPLELEVEITAAKHTGGEDWSATKTGTILVKSPVPEITEMSVSPDPAQAYLIHMLRIEVEDKDEGPKNLKYTIRCFGGSLGTHSGEASNSDKYSRVFYSGETSEGIEWTGPAQGVDELDPVEFKAKMENLEGLSKNLGANRFGVVGGVYKAANGLNGNAQNLASGFHSLSQSENWREGAYRSLDLGLEGFKTFVGVYTLGFKAAPGALGKLSNDAGDLVDGAIGHMQAKLKGLAHQARVNAAETRITTYSCAAIVEDSDGYVDWHLYQFDLEYEGFESDKQYGKDDEISG